MILCMYLELYIIIRYNFLIRRSITLNKKKNYNNILPSNISILSIVPILNFNLQSGQGINQNKISSVNVKLWTHVNCGKNHR